MSPPSTTGPLFALIPPAVWACLVALLLVGIRALVIRVLSGR